MRKSALLSILVGALVPLSAPTRAQVTTATRYGTVEDSSGAVIPGGRRESPMTTPAWPTRHR